MSVKLVTDPSYIKPFRVKIDIQSIDGQTDYYVFDSFNSSCSNINILDASLRTSQSDNGDFEILIEDSDRKIDRTVIGPYNRVEFFGKKQSSSPWIPLATCYARGFSQLRDNTNVLKYRMTGYTSRVIFAELIGKFKRKARRQGMGESGIINDGRMWVSRLFNDFVRNTDIVMPSTLINKSIEDIGWFTANSIKQIPVFIPEINFDVIRCDVIADTIANAGVAIWGVTPTNDIYLRHPTEVHSGHVIKDTVDPTLDLASKYSYILGGWEIEDKTDVSSGFGVTDLAKNSTRTRIDTSSNFAIASHSLTQLTIAQEFIPSTARFEHLQLAVSKDNGGRPIHGHIVYDFGGKPTGPIVASFGIKQEDITESSATFMYIQDIAVVVPKIEPDKKYWIILYDRGDPVTGDGVRWWHNDTGPINNLKVAYAFGRETHRKHRKDVQWQVVTTGPTYAFGFFESTKALSVAHDPLAKDKYGYQTQLISDVPMLRDSIGVNRYLSSVVSFTAKPVRRFNLPRVIIPDVPFENGKMVTLIDTKTGFTGEKATNFEVDSIAYHFGSSSGGTGGLGTRTCDIIGVDWYDYLTELES